MQDSNSAVAPLLDADRARERFSSRQTASSENFHRRDLENAIQLDRWLREHDVRLDLG